MKNGKWMAVAVATVLAGGMTTVALAGDGHGGRRDHARQGMRHRRGRFFEFLASLQFTDAQRQTMLDKARTAAPIVESARAEARRLVANAWAQASKDAKDGTVDRAALREQVKTQIKALREKTWPQIEPLAKDVAATLTPEQRQKLVDAGVKRGRTVDDAKIAKFMGMLITRPMAVPYLEARLGVASPR
jgi:Spy/CpxP family protein refolding chaperone